MTIISQNCTDDELSAAVAEHVAGWKNIRMSKGRPFMGDDEGQDTYDALCGSPPGEAGDYEILPYSLSADAIIHLAESGTGCWKYSSYLKRATYFKDPECKHQFYYDGHGPLARALCLALLCANGVKVAP